jgi:hypothetical protein
MQIPEARTVCTGPKTLMNNHIWMKIYPPVSGLEETRHNRTSDCQCDWAREDTFIEEFPATGPPPRTEFVHGGFDTPNLAKVWCGANFPFIKSKRIRIV